MIRRKAKASKKMPWMRKTAVNDPQLPFISHVPAGMRRRGTPHTSTNQMAGNSPDHGTMRCSGCGRVQESEGRRRK
ncbi:hypothetical protein JTE90_024599 [Oedothorax gibbosus]|uniref:Uncharacterized protein n=1 Tax=Oedothorax gibbosus TaxID=931172 RepID=A0AAV6VF60_9ARAC|nr:hypothetical protein JTE90_024599 [Oedothorax gibbosus]